MTRSEPNRICRCMPECHKSLTQKSRIAHFKKLTADEKEDALPSLTDPEAVDKELRQGMASIRARRQQAKLATTSQHTSDRNLRARSIQNRASTPGRLSEHPTGAAHSPTSSTSQTRAAGPNPSQLTDNSQHHRSDSPMNISDGAASVSIAHPDHQEAPSLSAATTSESDEDTDKELYAAQDWEEDIGARAGEEARAWGIAVEEYEEEVSAEEIVRTIDEMSLEPQYRKALADILDKDPLDDEDLDNIYAFKLRLAANMPRRAFNMMRVAFAHRMNILSEYLLVQHIALLSRIIPLWIPCCVNTCIAYTGSYANLKICPLCQEPCQDSRGKTRRLFCYLPLAPRLVRLFLNPQRVKDLSYRSKYTHVPGTISDVFDSEHYQTLCKTNVTIDGKQQSYCYFSDQRDIAFGLSLDGYLLYKRKRGGPSATPLLAQVYDYAPDIRVHRRNLICLGVIPGPRGPRRLSTFLQPFEDECALLAQGIEAFDSHAEETFALHAYHIFPMGDIIALQKLINVKGVNAVVPCRSCRIRGIKCPGGKTHYVPLVSPNQTEAWDPENLPLRQHSDWEELVRNLDDIVYEKDKEAMKKFCGIKGNPALGLRVPSVDFGRGIPWDFMHLLFENVVKNMVKLWKGTFKGLDEGTGDYVLSEEVWEMIGLEGKAATKTIPADFVRKLGDIHLESSYFTAEEWAFWFMHLAPHLLKNRLPNPYYDHFIHLVGFMKTCLQFTITEQELIDLTKTIIQWVREYERLYYQYDASRLSVCTLTIHGLLHVPDNIRFCGPVWTTWTFWMERYCGFLQSSLRSKSKPWANLNNIVLQRAYLDSILSVYGLDLIRHPNDMRKGERRLPEYEKYILCPPRRNFLLVDSLLKKRIAAYLRCFAPTTPTSKLIRLIPAEAISWYKFRILDGGDSFRTTQSQTNSDVDRDKSLVRYEYLVKDGDRNVVEVAYGFLELLLQITFPDTRCLGDFSGATRVFSLITPCVTNSKSADLEVVSYSKTTTPLITDLENVKGVVGRVQTAKGWGLIDRGQKFTPTVFPESDHEADN